MTALELDIPAPEPMDRAFEEASARRMAPREGDALDAGIAAAVSIVIAVWYAAGTMEVVNWYLLPAIVSGALMGKEVVAWFRKKLDLFDAKALVGAIGWLFFFLNPVLYIAYGALDHPDLPSPENWQRYLAIHGWMSLVCVLLYLGAQRMGFTGQSRRAVRIYWHMPQGVSFVMLLCVGLSLLSWLIFFFRLGGYAGILQERWDPTGAASGMGVLQVFGESAPLLLFLALTSIRGTSQYRKSSAIAVFVLIVAMAIAKFVISGLGGARERVLWPLLMIIGVAHYYWRPVKRWHLVAAVVPMLLFLHFYVLYKTHGKELLGVFRGVPLSYYTAGSRKPVALLLGDLGRTNIQASVLYVLTEHPEMYSLKLGKTYAFALMQPVPGWIWHAEYKPWTWSKGYAAFEQSFMTSYYHPRAKGGPASRQYGLAGESLLNFGVIGPFLTFPIWGFLVGRLRRFYTQLRPGDARLVAAMFFANMAFVVLPSDFDNIWGFFIWHALFPLLVVRFTSTRVRAAAAPQIAEVPAPVAA